MDELIKLLLNLPEVLEWWRQILDLFSNENKKYRPYE